MKKDFVMPIAVLTVICLVISAALAVTNTFTQPAIAAAAAARAEAARSAIIPEADGFVTVDTQGLPPSVLEVFDATNGTGRVFIMAVTGYGGEMTVACGVGPDGRVLSSTILSHGETKGLGSKVAEPEFEARFTGQAAPLDFDAISGATISSRAYYTAVEDALAAHRLLEEGT